MEHDYNRAAFQTGAAASNGLLGTYCSLIDLELALKVHLSPSGWMRKHRIIEWLTTLGETSLAVQLGARISVLRCTLQDGTEGPVEANNYPGIRYLRHETDFPGTSTDAQLRDVLDIIADIKVALRSRGVRI